MAKKKFIRNEYNTRVACICSVRTAKIMYDGVCIGTISEESNDAGEVDWVIRPHWDVLKDHYIEIQGIDMDLHLDEYVRTFTPEFVIMRTIPDGREDLPEMLAELGMDYNDKFEFMVRTGGRTNSKMTVERIKDDDIRNLNLKEG